MWDSKYLFMNATIICSDNFNNTHIKWSLKAFQKMTSQKDFSDNFKYFQNAFKNYFDTRIVIGSVKLSES